jgi:DNA-binding winged helix-turn-helix (wHTH) protein/Tol biopolymer transport system component
MTVQTSRSFRFAEIEVREQELRAMRNREPLSNEPKAFRVLLYLLQHAGHLVSKNELLDAVWGDTAVTENSLTRAIALLRRVLEDDPHQPRLIETVSTAGYRFIAPVQAEGEQHSEVRGGVSAAEGEKSASPASAGEPGARLAVRGRAATWKWFAASGGVVLLASAILVSPLRWSQPSVRIIGYKQITHDGWRKRLVGTDGIRLYFTRDLDPQTGYAASIADGQAATLPISLPNSDLLDVSPDGSTLLVVSQDEGRPPAIWTVNEPGGSQRHLFDGNVLPIALCRNGKSLVYDSPERNIRMIATDGSADHLLVPAKDYWPGEDVGDLAMSPDGRTIRLTKNKKYWQMSSDGKDVHPMFPGWLPSYLQCCGRWTPDGAFFVFVTRDPHIRDWDQSPATQVWAVDDRQTLFRLRKSKPIPMDFGPLHWSTPVPGRDSKTIFTRGVIMGGELVRFNPASRQFEPYIDGISAELLAFSPDRKSMVYVTFPEGVMWRANLDGSNRIQLTNPPLYPKNPRWSPDGTQIAFMDETPERKDQIYLLSSQGGGARVLLPEYESSQNDPTWSPDGQKIVFAASSFAENSGAMNLRILNMFTQQIMDVPGSKGLMSPRWSPDGRYVAAMVNSGRELRVFDIDTQRWTALRTGINGFPTWSADGGFIYYLHLDFDQSVAAAVERIRPAGGAPERVVDLKGFRFTGIMNYWMGVDPGGNPLLLRDVGNDDIYALTLERK